MHSLGPQRLGRASTVAWVTRGHALCHVRSWEPRWAADPRPRGSHAPASSGKGAAQAERPEKHPPSVGVHRGYLALLGFSPRGIFLSWCE